MTTAFSLLRLSGQLVSATPDSRLIVNGIKTLSTLDSGAFTSVAAVNAVAANLTTTGVTLGARIDTVAANLTTTGVSLGASINTVAASVTTLSGWAAATLMTKGSEQSFINALATGADTYAVSFPTGFAAKPRVGVELEVSAPVCYAHTIGAVTAAGFTLYLSDTLVETGCLAHVEARF